MNHYPRRTRIPAMAWIAIAMLLSPVAGLAQATPEAAGTPAATPGATPLAEPGPPRYPDLVALPPEDLYFSTEILADGEPHLLLRFSTTAVNLGDGPLELAGDAIAETGAQVSQLVYDAVSGGVVVERYELGLDLIHHPQHHHFHLANFAAYELFRVEGDTLVPTGQGGKQSSCVLDSERFVDTGPERRRYAECELDHQGLSVGWGDRYSASLPDQWIDLEGEQLADGAYVVRYVVDPLGQMAEGGRTDNNAAETRFTVRDGAIVGQPEPPRCQVVGEDNGPPGTRITIACSHFPEGAVTSVHWDAWDPWATSQQPIARFRSAGTVATEVSITIPPVQPGGYPVTVVAWDAVRERHVSASVIVGVQPGQVATPVASPMATPQSG